MIQTGLASAPAGAHRGWTALGVFLLAAAFANAWLFVLSTTNPLVSSDAWYFVETFVQKALDGTVEIADLYAKRDGFDHAQPLNKLFLWVNTRYLGLDFMYEAQLGLLCAFAGVLVMKRAADLSMAERPGPRYWLLIAAIGAAYVSLNSSMVMTWSLVTFGYVYLLAALLTILCAWHAWRKDRPLVLVIAMAACVMIADDTAVLLAASLILTLLWTGVRTGRMRSALLHSSFIVAVVAGYLVAYGVLDSTPRAASAPIAETASSLVAMVSGKEGWRIFAIFASSVAFVGQLQAVASDSWPAVQVALGVLVLASHVVYWWRLITMRPDAARFMSAALMLLGYGYIAGILYARVAQAGLGYLNEPRYALLYQLQIVAILLSLVPVRECKASDQPVLVPLAAALLILAVQVPLARHSWSEARFNRTYWRQMAGQMMAMSQDPRSTPSTCVPLLVICSWDAERRSIVITRLKTYRLNLFSSDFRIRHGFVDQ